MGFPGPNSLDKRPPANHARGHGAACEVLLPLGVPHDIAVPNQWQPHDSRHLGAALDVGPVGLAAVALLARAAVERHCRGAPRRYLGDELVRDILPVIVALAVIGSGVEGVRRGLQRRGREPQRELHPRDAAAVAACLERTSAKGQRARNLMPALLLPPSPERTAS